MKAAISIPDDLFRMVDDFSRKHGISRSEVFARAVEEYFEKRRSWELLEAVNRACEQAETPEEKKVRKRTGNRYAKILSGEPY